MSISNETTQVFMLSASDLREVIAEIISESLAKHEAEKNDRLVSASQAAEMLSVDRTTLWRWEKEHYLTPVRMGRKVFYRLADIETCKH